MNQTHHKTNNNIKNPFTKTLTHQFSYYTTLPNEDKLTDKDKIKLKNSMNRILDA
jgi:hypothetical protein